MDKYVSDALERILDATPVRNQVSQQVCEHLQEYGPLISSVLGQSAQYFSSKCMGYPSIWFYFVFAIFLKSNGLSALKV